MGQWWKAKGCYGPNSKLIICLDWGREASGNLTEKRSYCGPFQSRKFPRSIECSARVVRENLIQISVLLSWEMYPPTGRDWKMIGVIFGVHCDRGTHGPSQRCSFLPHPVEALSCPQCQWCPD